MRRYRYFAETESWTRVSQRTFGFEREVRPAVWQMVQSTYAKLGLILDHPGELDEYNVWDIYYVDGIPRAFVLGKTTPYGIKLGLAGSDGSKLGRTAVKSYIADWYEEPGHYAEVSHRMEELALESEAPLVCAVYVPEVLRKSVMFDPDGLHYRRTIKNVGEVAKILVGRPQGVPVTSSVSPKCPLPARAMSGTRAREADTSADAVFSHVTSLVDL